MKKTGLVVFALVSALWLCSCEIAVADLGSPDDATGKITVTGIPGEYNGKCLYAEGRVNKKRFISMDHGGQKYFAVNGASVVIPLRDVTGLNGTVYTLPPAFTEAGPAESFIVIVYADAQGEKGKGRETVWRPVSSEIVFTRGCAEINWKDGGQ